MALELVKENFNSHISENEYTIVDIHTSWCGPCKQLSPIIEELATEYDGKVSIVKLSAETERDVAVELGVRNVPTVLFYKNGEIVNRFTGMKSKGDIVNMIKDTYEVN